MDPLDPSLAPDQIMQKFVALTDANLDVDGVDEEQENEGLESREELEDDDDDDDDAEDTSDETDDPTKPETVEKKRRRLRLKSLKKRKKARAYEFSGESDVVGIIFLEITKITDLPPERNSKSTKIAYVFSHKMNVDRLD